MTFKLSIVVGLGVCYDNIYLQKKTNRGNHGVVTLRGNFFFIIIRNHFKWQYLW